MPLNLLDEQDKTEDKGFSKDSLEHMSNLLELKLQDFGINANVVEVLPGQLLQDLKFSRQQALKQVVSVD